MRPIKKGGGVDQFVMASPDGEDGHHLYMHVSAWSDTVTAFLKAQNLLPLGDTGDARTRTAQRAHAGRLGDQDKEIWRRFLLAPPYKTLVANESGQLSILAAAFDQSLADGEAIDRCKKANGGGKHCSIVARDARREVGEPGVNGSR